MYFSHLHVIHILLFHSRICGWLRSDEQAYDFPRHIFHISKTWILPLLFSVSVISPLLLKNFATKPGVLCQFFPTPVMEVICSLFHKHLSSIQITLFALTTTFLLMILETEATHSLRFWKQSYNIFNVHPIMLNFLTSSFFYKTSDYFIIFSQTVKPVVHLELAKSCFYLSNF